MKIKDMQKKYFTEKGLEALRNKLKTSIEFYNNNNLFEKINKVKMLGFTTWKVDSKEELKARIKELVQILGDVKIMEEIETNKTNKEIKKSILKMEIIK